MGNTTLAFRGEVYLTEIIQNIGPIIQSQASAIKDGNLNITASGNATVINGQHIGYVENVLNKEFLSYEVPILQLVTQLAGSLLTGNETVSDLGSLLGGLLGNLTGLTGDGVGSTANLSSLAGRLGSSLNMARVLSVVSSIGGHKKM